MKSFSNFEMIFSNLMSCPQTSNKLPSLSADDLWSELKEQTGDIKESPQFPTAKDKPPPSPTFSPVLLQ